MKKSLKNTTQNVAMYVHFPFCKSRCKYCTFTSSCDYNFQQEYFDALVNEIVSNARKDVVVDTLFFGGGTPSSVDAKYLQMVFDAIFSNYVLSPNCEITVECNPESLTTDKINLFVKNNVNRISIGMQSANDTTLAKIGRIHNFKQVKQAVDNVVQAGITNVNVDLIIGLPETKQDFVNTLNQVVSLPITHLSAYALEIYEDTQLFKEIQSGAVTVNFTDDDLVDLYDLAMQHLAKYGYRRYEVSNFSKPGYQCRHNLSYWRTKHYFGFGCSAHGYMDGIRYENATDPQQYVALVNANGNAVIDNQLLTLDDKCYEYVMLGLRLEEGVSLLEFKRLFNQTLTDKYPAIPQLINQKLLYYRVDDSTKDCFVAVCPDKFYVLNEILSQIL